MTASQATGCASSGGYYDYATSHGYNRVEVLDWTSSAGDWSFLVSKNGKEWFILYQINNYPRAGFTWTIDTGHSWLGTIKQAYKQIEAEY